MAEKIRVGDISRVNAHLNTFIERPGVAGQALDSASDSALLSLEFKNGAQGMIHASAVAHLGDRNQEQQIFLHGEKGTLEVDFNFVTGHRMRGLGHDETEFETLTIPERIVNQVDTESSILDQLLQMFSRHPIGTRLFVDAIINDQPVSPNFNDGLKVQEVIEAALASDRQGCWVSLP